MIPEIPKFTICVESEEGYCYYNGPILNEDKFSIIIVDDKEGEIKLDKRIIKSVRTSKGDRR